MSQLYPSLHERFKSEGICPICLIEMAHTPRFTCNSGHIICHRCRPYYYSCPQCLNPLHEIPAPIPGPYEPPPPTHHMPHPPHLSHPYPPSAPELHDFHDRERLQTNWQPPEPPTEEQDLIPCPYSHLGCSARFVPLLRDMHVSRCQYKHHSSEGLQPCEVPDNSERMACRYQYVGCNVRAPRWRLDTHENLCIYKDRQQCSPVEDVIQHLAGSCSFNDDPNELVNCRFHSAGCMVRMPRWKKESHESKCNYGGGGFGYNQPGACNMMCDPEEYVDCRWAAYGCRVRPKYARKYIHEEKCNYRM